MKKLLTLLLLISVNTGWAATTFEFNATCKDAYNEIFNLNFARVTKLLELEKQKNPGNAVVPYLHHYMDFLKAFISEERNDFERLKNNIDDRLRNVDKLPDSSPWKNMARGEMLLQYAVLKFKWKENFSAGYYFRKSFKLLEENHKSFPTFVPTLKCLGFFHAAIGTVPENYKWLANLVGLRGTISQGANELDIVLNKVKQDATLKFMFDEVAILRIFIATLLEKDFVVASEIINDDRFAENKTSPLHLFIRANALTGEGKQKEALEKLRNFKTNQASYQLLYLEYMKGMLLLNQLDFDSEKHFIKFVTEFKGTSFIKSGWHKLAWIHFLRNDVDGYNRCMAKVRVAGNDFTDEDKQAMKEANNNEMPNAHLLRSRLLFDGGNYSAALSSLTNTPENAFPKPKDQIEFTYRLARIFDKKGQHEKAIQYYTTTYHNGHIQQWYFAANAALMNGLIYESQNNTLKAREWYNKALSLRNHEYQNSIDQKAEAGLNRMINDR